MQNTSDLSRTIQALKRDIDTDVQKLVHEENLFRNNESLTAQAHEKIKQREVEIKQKEMEILKLKSENQATARDIEKLTGEHRKLVVSIETIKRDQQHKHQEIVQIQQEYTTALKSSGMNVRDK